MRASLIESPHDATSIQYLRWPQLEAALQTQLFHQYGRGIRLTEQGTQFQVKVDAVVRKLLQAGTDLRAGE